MKQQLPIGISDFEEIIKGDYYFVDKSLFIKEVIDHAKIILITRPRRFGKTMNLSMLKYFYDCQEDYHHLFEDLAIQSAGERYMGKQGQHPVIFISFKDIKAKTWEDALGQIIYLIRENLSQSFPFLFDWEELNPLEKEQLEAIQKGENNQIYYSSILKSLSAILARYHQQKTVILIDEYDTPIHAAYIHGYYEEMIAFMRDFLSTGFKDNIHLEKGVITGILQIAKESIFSGFNNPDMYSLLAPEMADHFGFKESEVAQMLTDFEFEESQYEEVKQWYNGYVFGEHIIYNPWSIINYVGHPKRGPHPYWVNTSNNALLKQLFFTGGANIEEDLHSLIAGKKLRREISENLIFRELEYQPEAVWTLLLFAGYLKAENMQRKRAVRSYELSIPNEEVAHVYERFILNWVSEQSKVRTFDPMLEALIAGKVEIFEAWFARFVLNVFSFHDTQASEAESFYHAFLLGLVVRLQDEYIIKSNRESGLGRYDLMLVPKEEAQLGIVIEIKRPQRNKNQSLEDALKFAAEQIQQNQYIAELQQMNIPHILKLAIAVEGKEVMMQEVS